MAELHDFDHAAYYPDPPDVPEGILPQPSIGPVYHYTNAEGLFGLIDQWETFASHALTMNDPLEGSYGWQLIRSRAAERGLDREGILADVLAEQESGGQAFIMSGTTLQGNLNQYRLYGMYQVQVQVGIWRLKWYDGDLLGGRDPDKTWRPESAWRPVIYGSEAAMPFVDRFLDWAAGFNEGIARQDRAGTVRAAGSLLSWHFKHDAYEHEEEVRLLFDVPEPMWANLVDVRTRRGVLVPFVRARPDDQGLGPVVAVELGPTVQGDTSAAAIQQLWRRKDTALSHTAPAVTTSAIKYRG